jgi:hypothetical protein
LSDGAEPTDWQDVTGPDWLSHDPWPVTEKAWQMPAFTGQQYAFRRYGGDAFRGGGAMPDLYQVYIRIRPKEKDADGTIAVCPYYLSPTQYALVLLDLKAKNVSLWEMNGATPTSGIDGAYDLSKNHRGWRPLPSPDHDGGYSIKVKVNTQWNSMAVWVGDTWIDTPKVASVTDQPHYVAVRTSGVPQEILKIGINRFTDPLQAR